MLVWMKVVVWWPKMVFEGVVECSMEHSKWIWRLVMMVMGEVK